MQTLIHADIFFFISTIAVVIISICLAVAIIFVIMILKNLHRLSETVRIQARNLGADIDDLRAKARGFSWAIAFKLFKRFFIKDK